MLKKIKVSGFFGAFFLVMIFLGMAAEALCLLFALIIHEVGHISVAKMLGCQFDRLVIQPLGGYLYLDQLIEVQPQIEARVALAGPLANLLTVAVVMAIVPHQAYLASYFIRANLILMAFNLLPALPLDGGRVLRARLAEWFSFYRATKIIIASGFICGLLLLAFAVYIGFQGSLNPTIIAAGVFLLYNAYVERRQLLIPLIRYVLRRQRSLQTKKFLAAHVLVAAPGARVNEVLKQIRPQKYYQISVLDKNYKIKGVLTEHQLLHQIRAGTGQRSLLDVVGSEMED